MKTRAIYLLSSVLALVFMAACKKDKTDDSIEGRFQGTWMETSARQVTIVVSKPPAGEQLPGLIVNNGTKTLFFDYRFNSSGDSVYINDLATGGAKNIPCKITFSANGRSFTITRFHSELPDVNPLSFDKRD